MISAREIKTWFNSDGPKFPVLTDIVPQMQT